MKHHVGLFVALCIAVVPLTERAQRLSVVDDKLEPTRIAEWLKAVEAHQPGTLDAPAKTCGAWSPLQLEQTVGDFIGLLELERRTRANPSAGPVVTYKKKTFTLSDIDAMFGLTADDAAGGGMNRIVKRAALLHTDIARFVRSVPVDMRVLGGVRVTVGQASVTALNDGNTTGSEIVSPHWDLARRLLDEVTPSPTTDDLVRAWYYAMVARDVAQRRWGTAAPTLSRARRVLPNDARIIFYSGLQHEAMAAPDVQNAMAAMRTRPTARVGVMSEEVELLDAERFFRQAITIDPAFAEARLRLGHVLGCLGRQGEAAEELQRATAELTDPQLLYYAAMFLGRADTQLGRRDEAHKAFERASGLFPLAQAPLIAEGQLARREDDPPRALASVGRLLNLPGNSRSRNDPWWAYDVFAGRDADDLMTALYRPFLSAPGR